MQNSKYELHMLRLSGTKRIVTEGSSSSSSSSEASSDSKDKVLSVLESSSLEGSSSPMP